MEAKAKVDEVVETEVDETKEVKEGEELVNKAELESLAKEMAVELTNKAVQERVKKLNEKHEKEKAEAVAEALKKAQMTTEELEQEAFTDLQNKYDELNIAYTKEVNGSLAKSKLTEAGLPITETLVNSLVADIDNIDETIKDLNDNFNAEIQKRVDERLKESNFDFKTAKELDSKPVSIHRNTASRIGAR